MLSSRPIAIIGASGQLGSDLLRAAAARGLPALAFDHDTVDVTDRASLDRALERSGADTVINCAAFHQVDRCEADPERAFLVNAGGARHVAEAARAIGARVIQVSTDYVFDGARPAGESYTEGDAPRPINVYGASKLAGEELVRSIDPECLIVRVAGLFGRTGARGKGGSNFVDTIRARALAGAALSVVTDQYVSPTYAVDAADAIMRLAGGTTSGVLHIAGGGACSWYDLATFIVRTIGVNAHVEPTVSEPPKIGSARRPANTALATDRLASLLGAPPRSWQDAVRAYLDEKVTRI